MQTLRLANHFKSYSNNCSPKRSFSEKKNLQVARTFLSPSIIPVIVSHHYAASLSFSKHFFSSTTTDESDDERITSQSWSKEWERLGLGARLPHPSAQMTNMLFVQTGFGVDQHGDRSVDGATKAAVRAVRNAIEFNSIPGVIESVPGGRKEMLIRVKLGVPPLLKEMKKNNGIVESSSLDSSLKSSSSGEIPVMDVDLSHVAKVFPYGRLMPIDVVAGGLSFPTGRVVPELGDTDDEAICVVASIQIGYDDGTRADKDKNTMDNNDNKLSTNKATHKTYNTNDGH